MKGFLLILFVVFALSSVCSGKGQQQSNPIPDIFSNDTILNDQRTYAKLARPEVDKALFKLAKVLPNFSDYFLKFTPKNGTKEYRNVVERSRLILDLFCFAYDPDTPLNKTKNGVIEEKVKPKDLKIFEETRSYLDKLHLDLGNFDDIYYKEESTEVEIQKLRLGIVNASKALYGLISVRENIDYFLSPQDFFFLRDDLPKNVWGNKDISRYLPLDYYTGVGNIAMFCKELCASLIKKWSKLDRMEVKMFTENEKEFDKLHNVRKLLRVLNSTIDEFTVLQRNPIAMKKALQETTQFYDLLSVVKDDYQSYWFYKKKKKLKKANKYKKKGDKRWKVLRAYYSDNSDPNFRKFKDIMADISDSVTKSKTYKEKKISIWKYGVITAGIAIIVISLACFATWYYKRNWDRNNGYQPVPSSM